MMVGTITYGVAYINGRWNSYTQLVEGLGMFEAFEYIKGRRFDDTGVVHIWMIDWEVVEDKDDNTTTHG